MLIRRSSVGVRSQFAIIGTVVLIISLLTLSSVYSLIRHVFIDSPIVLSFAIGLLWCVLISNLYIFLLYTISPTLLPVSRNSRRRLRKGEVLITETFVYSPTEISRTVSLMFRVVMILLLACFIAQPLNMSFLISEYPTDEYMGMIKSRLLKMPESYVLTAVWCVIFMIPIFLKFKIRHNVTSEVEFDSAGKFKNDLKYIRTNLVSPESFQLLFQSIKNVKIRDFVTSDFYFYKSLVEYKFILEEYDDFSKKHALLLNEAIREANDRLSSSMMLTSKSLDDPYLEYLLKYRPEKFEYFADAPFRTTPKSDDATYHSEDEFLKMLYKE